MAMYLGGCDILVVAIPRSSRVGSLHEIHLRTNGSILSEEVS
jgi:hypothetical protein